MHQFICEHLRICVHWWILMKLDLFTLDKLSTYPLVDGVVVHPLTVNRDDRGTLTEALKSSWKDVYEEQNRPFAQMYFSETQPGVARDEDRWHYHPGGQEDRFGIIKGDIVVALYDDRKESPTYQQLNLFLMGEGQGDMGQYLLLIPPRVLHGFVVVSQQPAILVNYPTRLYDPTEEQRIPFGEVKLKDGSSFSWQAIREQFK